MLLDLPKEKIAGETFNAGYRNMKVIEIAEVVQRVVEEEFPKLAPIEIERTSSDDDRSYRVTSDKIADKIGFVPEFTVEDAVRDLCRAFRDEKLPESFDNDWYFNVRTMKKNAVV
jgi:nucleoside-diphosphate-sugar epimerase